MSLFINCCSGQKPYGKPFVNVDIQERWKPDYVADCRSMPMFDDNSAQVIVLEHGLEHFQCGEFNGAIREFYRILQPGGSLIVFVPDMRELAKAWLKGNLSDETYLISVYGAYMGDPADTHKFGFTSTTLPLTLGASAPWKFIHTFNWRAIPGATPAKDFWILSQEAIK